LHDPAKEVTVAAFADLGSLRLNLKLTLVQQYQAIFYAINFYQNFNFEAGQ
jgi:hypothetical protein